MASVRQQINVAVGPRALWRAFTTADGLASWWVDSGRIDAKEGGRVVLDTEDDEGNTLQECGIIRVYRPTRALEFTFDRAPETPWAGSTVKVALARDGADTRVVIVHSGKSETFTDEAKRDALVREWRGALRSLRGALEAS